jgi:hypothetical protein
MMPRYITMRKIGALFVFLLLAVPALADVITLTFEGLKDGEPIDDFYNGGFGGFGSGPGPDDGIIFDSDSDANISQAAGGLGTFSGAPTMPTVMTYFLGSGDMMNVPAGFTTGISFFYSAGTPGVVNVYSGLNDTGILLASIDLPVTPSTPGQNGCLPVLPFCPWVAAGVNFSGTAMSVVFSGIATNSIGFDNVTLGSSTPTPGIPEPSMMVVLSVGIAALVGFRSFRPGN